MRILLVEDDELLGDCVRCGLIQYNYNVDWVKNGLSAWGALQTECFDLVILDLGLPKLSGEEVLKNMRSKNIVTPVIVVTARDNVCDRIKGLDIGADDYIGKPFDLDELCARIRAIQRRATSCVESIITIGNITLDIEKRQVFKAGEKIKVHRREFMLLQFLMENAGKVLSQRRISDSLYSWEDSIDSNAQEVHIHNLRKKLGHDKIITRRGVGYLFVK